MAFTTRTTEKHNLSDADCLEENSGFRDFSDVAINGRREQERRARREIANSNERRRMQSINSGFQALRMLVPNNDGDKLSKAAILQQTAEYIFALEQDKTRLLQQNTTLKRILSECNRGKTEEDDRPVYKKAKTISETRAPELECQGKDLCDDSYIEEMQKELIELRCQLERERRLRILLDDQKQKLESELGEAKTRAANAQTQSSTTRQSLDTIVQAIKHLEGDENELRETPTKCKGKSLANGSCTADGTSRRLVV